MADPPRHDAAELERVLREILAWIGDPAEPSPSPASEADEVCTDGWSSIDFCLERRQRLLQLRKRPIVFLCGPSGSGKGHVARLLAERLAVPLREIDDAAGVRTGRPFEDILSASHGQRHVMRQFLHSGIGPTADAGLGQHHHQYHEKIRMVVLVDKVDLVFECDRFYSPLNAFLRDVPDSVLVILSSSCGMSILRGLVELPSGSLATAFSGGKGAAPPTAPKISSLASAARHSDLALLLCLPRHEHVRHRDAPVCCVPDDLVQIEPPNEARLLLCKEEHNDDYDDAQLCDPQAPLHDGRLLQDLQGELHMANCRRRADWILEYRPYWRAMESEAAERHELRARRTTRQARRPRAHLAGIPSVYIDRLQAFKY